MLNIHYINPLLRYPVSGPVFFDLGKIIQMLFLKHYINESLFYFLDCQQQWSQQIRMLRSKSDKNCGEGNLKERDENAIFFIQ